MKTPTESFDLIVLGGGPAGTSAAAAGGYLGKNVALVEKTDRIGGAGINTGTLPSKTLRETSLVLSGWRSRRLFGVDLSLRLTFLATLALSACAPNGLPPAEGLHQSAVTRLGEARKATLSDEQRAVLYLDAAKESSGLLGSAASAEPARVSYNKAVTDLTVLLRYSAKVSLWNRPLTLTHGGSTYRLRFAKGTREIAVVTGNPTRSINHENHRPCPSRLCRPKHAGIFPSTTSRRI